MHFFFDTLQLILGLQREESTVVHAGWRNLWERHGNHDLKARTSCHCSRWGDCVNATLHPPQCAFLIRQLSLPRWLCPSLSAMKQHRQQWPAPRQPESTSHTQLHSVTAESWQQLQRTHRALNLTILHLLSYWSISTDSNTRSFWIWKRLVQTYQGNNEMMLPSWSSVTETADYRRGCPASS